MCGALCKHAPSANLLVIRLRCRLALFAGALAAEQYIPGEYGRVGGRVVLAIKGPPRKQRLYCVLSRRRSKFIIIMAANSF